MLLTLLAIIGLLIIVYFLFVNFYPSFGGDVSKALKSDYSKSDNYKEGQFVNEKDVPKNLNFSETVAIAYKFFTTKVPKGRPEKDLKVQKIDSVAVSDYTQDTRLIWFGHSAFLLQMEGKNILIDPMFGDVAAPHPWLGASRFNKEMPIDIEKLPNIDAVIISHDHYDHLDYESINKLKGKVNHYFVPLGVGVHLLTWGIPQEKITELDWWEEVELDTLQLACTPAQHFSGRKFGSEQSTLWSSWVIISETERIFFSGDSGYSDHFITIGDTYGPFDFAMLECGQYNESWADIHMMPEETAQAGLDLKAKAIMPIHWGGFKLALHSWTDPIERVTKKAEALGLPLVTPMIGEPIVLNQLPKPNSAWWSQL